MKEIKMQNRRNFIKSGLAATGSIAVGSVFAKSNEDEVLSVFEAMEKRQSVRKFKSTPVPEDHLEMILRAAHSAPSPRNRQGWKFLVIRDRATLDKIKNKCIELAGERSREYYTDYLSAPVYVVVLVNVKTRNPVNDIAGGALATQNLITAARALGYGTVFCTNSIGPEITKEILHIPDDYQRICITPIGIPDKWPEKKEKKPLKDVVVYETL